jgi:hypothetical protein
VCTLLYLHSDKCTQQKPKDLSLGLGFQFFEYLGFGFGFRCFANLLQISN